MSRILAWALYLSGWIAFGSLAQALAGGPLQAFGLMAGWVLASSVARAAIARFVVRGPVHQPWLRALAMASGCAAAWALFLCLQGGGGLPALAVAMGAWALLSGLASAAILGDAAPREAAGTPVAGAAAGALLAWAVCGDIAAMKTTSLVLPIAALAAGALLALRLRLPLPRNAGLGNRAAAGLPDCAWIGWPSLGPRDAPDIDAAPLRMAAFAMLPMMCSLPLMIGLCRGAGIAPQWVLGIHLAAMFVPALLLAACRRIPARGAALACASLLAGAALALALLPAGSAWLAVALLQGAGWSVAWTVSLRRDPHRAAWTRSRSQSIADGLQAAGWVLLFGAALSLAGLQALDAWPVGLGAAALLALLAGRRRAIREGSTQPTRGIPCPMLPAPNLSSRSSRSPNSQPGSAPP